jgi:hypothetical protein
VAGLLDLISHERSYGREFSDPISKTFTDIQLIQNSRKSELFQALRPAGSLGVNSVDPEFIIDILGEEQFDAKGQQESTYHVDGLDHLLFWSPLMPVKPKSSPLRICPQSHSAGSLPVLCNKDKDDNLPTSNLNNRLAPFDSTQPLIFVWLRREIERDYLYL